MTTSTASVPDAANDFYPYIPTQPSGPFPPASPKGDSTPPGFSATNDGVKESGMRGLAAAVLLVVVCFVVVSAVSALV
jgi:hypothetical protein